MNFKVSHPLKILLLLLFCSIAINVQSETNALGQQITVINADKKNQNIKK